MASCLLPGAVATDHQVEGDEHCFEGDVEDHQVVGGEDDDHERLEGQHEGRVGSAIVGLLLVPSRDEDEGDEAEGQEDHDQAEGVDAQRPGDAHLRDPLVALVHLVRGGGRPVEDGDGGDDAERELDEGTREGDDASCGAPQGRNEAEEGRARGRNGHEDGQPREVSSNHCTFHCRVPLRA